MWPSGRVPQADRKTRLGKVARFGAGEGKAVETIGPNK